MSISAPAQDAMDLSSLRRALPSVRVPDQGPQLYCAHCNLRYGPDWFHHEHYRCFFCMRFRSPSVTRYALLYETPWYFIQSGETDPREYYVLYFALLHRWADQRRIPFTEREAAYQDDLWRLIRD